MSISDERLAEIERACDIAVERLSANPEWLWKNTIGNIRDHLSGQVADYLDPLRPDAILAIIARLRAAEARATIRGQALAKIALGVKSMKAARRIAHDILEGDPE